MPKLATICCFGIVSAAAGIGHAQPRFARDPQVPVAVPFSERVRPFQPVATAAATPPLTIADAMPGVAKLMGPVRAEQEQILAELIQSTPDSEREEKADYYFRLGELYARQQLAWLTKAKGDARALNQAKSYLLKSVKVFKALTDNEAFRDYPKLDLALFYYAYTLQSGKYMKEARAVYDKLLKNFPSSIYVPDAHLAFAEYYAENNQLADADARYKEVLKFPKADGYWYAMYKLATLDLQLQREQAAVERLAQVVQGTSRDRKPQLAGARSNAEGVAEVDRRFDAVNRAARTALAHVAPERSVALMAKLDASSSPEVKEALAVSYLEQGAFGASIRIHRELLKTTPSSAHTCRWQYDVARSLLSIPTTARADQVKEVESLVARYVGSKGLDDDTELAECHDNAAAMASELARAYHIEGAKTKNAETLAQAERLYRAYLAAFADARAEVSADYGELQWLRAASEPDAKARTALFERAADAFTTAAGRPGAGRAAVLAWRNAIELDPKKLAGSIDLLKSAKARRVEAKTIPPRLAKLVASFEASVGELEASDELVVALIYRQHHHDDDAIQILRGFVNNHRDDEHAELAANALLDLLVRTHRFDDVLEIVDALAADTKFLAGKPLLMANLALLRSRSLRSR